MKTFSKLVFLTLFFSVVSSMASKTAVTGRELRIKRRMGVGVLAAGSLGIGGVNVEINLNRKYSVDIGYGGGSHYQAYHFKFKKVLAGESFLPYMAFGYARWQNFSDSAIDSTSPEFLRSRFMSENAKETGNISENLIYPAIGAQYLQLDGDWAGYSLYAEVLMLLDVEDFESAPTGSIGFMYYF